MAAGRERRLVKYQAAMIPKDGKPVCVFTDDLETDSMRRLMNLVLEDGHQLCAVLQKNDENAYRYVMGSRTADMRAFVKAFNAKFEGRGGGRPEMVQGTAVGEPEAIRSWICGKAGEM